MVVTFADANLAATCNSQRLMVEKWGQEGFERLGRRLLELVASPDIDHVAALPGAAVTLTAEDEVTVTFDRDRISFRAQVFLGGPGLARTEGQPWRLHVVELGVGQVVGGR